MTRYYLDTEFYDNPHTRTIELISIGLVSDDNRELYFASTEWLGNDGQADTARADDWLRNNVFSQIPSCTCPGVEDWRTRPYHPEHQSSCCWRSREEIADAIREFIHEEPKEQIEIWAYYASSDWVVFYQLFGKMIDMPKHFPFFVRCLKQYSIDIGFKGKFRELLPDSGHHDALADARWNREAHKLLHERRNWNRASLVRKLLGDLNDRAGYSCDIETRQAIGVDWRKIVDEMDKTL